VVAAEQASSVALDAVVITAGAALLAAIIAAVAAQARLRSNLAAERQRLDRTLDAEAARLNQQLNHDRELADLAELRGLFDGAARRIRTMHDLFVDFEAILKGHATSPDPGREPADAARARSDIVNLLPKAILDGLRLRGRLAGDHPVVQAHDDALVAMRGVPLPQWPPTEGAIEEMAKALEASWDVQERFIDTGRSHIGSRLPHQGPSS
jgi:hypothetical protein